MADAEGDRVVVEKYISNLREDSQAWMGFVTTKLKLEELKRDLQKVGISFKTESSHYSTDTHLTQGRKCM